MFRSSGILSKSLLATAVVFAALAVTWESAPRAQISGGSTGWCSDYEGNNFPCGSPPSSSGGGGYAYGGGCATAGNQMSDAAIARVNAQSSLKIGNIHFDREEYVIAADLYYNATRDDPANATAWNNLSTALSYAGSEATDRGDDMSALLFHERAVDARPDDETIYNYYDDAALYAPAKTCSTCAKALMNDVAYGLGASAGIHHYVHQAAVNYENCTRRLACDDSDGAHFYYLSRKSCYQTFLHSEDGFRACLKQGLEDRGYTFW